MKKHIALFALVIAAALSGSDSFAADNSKGLPHGGTPVIVGSHGYHLELVRNAEKGQLQAYVLDAHAANEVAVPEQSFDLVAKIAGKDEKITLTRTPAAGKPITQASPTFEGTAEWVKSAATFEAVIPTITLRGRTFKDIKVSFPKGSIHRGH